MTEEEILEYFTSIPMYYTWVLTKTSGETRNNLLGITNIMHVDKLAAKEWFINIKSYINKIEDMETYKQAMLQLKIIYSWYVPIYKSN